MNNNIRRVISPFIAAALLTITHNSFGAISVRDRCEQALKMMGVETQGTERGWASLCAGVIKNEPITRYGNWYGPGYWGGGEDPDKAGLKAPVDSLDAIAMRHDYGRLGPSKRQHVVQSVPLIHAASPRVSNVSRSSCCSAW
jgi:hypothetical protein